MKYRVVFLLYILLLNSCGIWKDSVPEVSAAKEQPLPVRTGPIVYVYTSAEFSSPSVLGPLLQEYAPPGAENLVRPFSSVTELGEPEHSAIVVTVGADNTINRPLSRLAEKRNDLRIFTLFSRSDPMLLEYFSELVFDIALDDDLLTPENETQGIPVSDTELSFLLLAVVDYADKRDWNISRSLQLLSQLDEVFRAAGGVGLPAGWDIRPYIDPDTGIRSRNHIKLHLPREQ